MSYADRTNTKRALFCWILVWDCSNIATNLNATQQPAGDLHFDANSVISVIRGFRVYARD